MSLKARHQIPSGIAMLTIGSLWRQRAGIAFGALALAVLIAAVGLALPNILTIGFDFEKNYNEGWNVYNAQRLLDHETIYDSNYWRVNNYPILSFLVVSKVGIAIGDLLLAGRIVALLSFAAIGILAATATRRLGGDWLAAIFAGGCSLGFCLIMAPAWVAVDDPQTLAEALMLAGLVTYLSGRGSRPALVATALLVVLAGFTKHNLFAIPLAITFDLALNSPRRLAAWIAICAGFAAMLLAFTRLVAGGDFLDHLLLPRTFIWYNVYYHLMKFLLAFKFPLLVVLTLSPILFNRQRAILAFYGIVSIVSGAMLAGYDGASFNMLLDAAVFLAIAAGLGVHELRRRLSRRLAVQIGAVGGIILLAQPLLGKIPLASRNLAHPGRLLAAARQTEDAFKSDIAYIAPRSGDAICESLLLCFEAGAPFTLDPYNSRQNILSGRLDQADLVRRVAAKAFSVIELRGEICDDKTSSVCHILHYPRKFNRFTDEFLYAVDQYYWPARQSSVGVFYVPR